MKQKISIKGDLRDLFELRRLIPERKQRINAASKRPLGPPPVNTLAAKIHPVVQHLEIVDVRDETPNARSFRLAPDPLAGTTRCAVFRAGQYLSLKVAVDGIHITRPYSICSSPDNAVNDRFYEITIRRKEGGFLTELIWNTWGKGTKIQASAPCGFFYYEPLRDSADIVGLAGGSGITPFRSLMRDLAANHPDARLTLIYGVRNAQEKMFHQEFQELENETVGRIKAYFVASEPGPGWDGPTGFLTAELISSLAGPPAGKTFFICGPQPMYNFLDKELAAFHLPARRVRREVFGELTDVTIFEDYPKELAGETFEITVHAGRRTMEIPAKATESILVSLERAGLNPPSQCRSGECGFCNTILINGGIYVSPENDGRRKAGLAYGYFHPCSAYPVSDMEIKLNPAAHTG
jgi:ferredoxin-NADP reductase